VGENLGISDKVRCVDQYRYNTGLISEEDMVAWYNAIDVLSACAYGEGFGLPIAEAQSCGTPVITTRSSSMEEVNRLGRQVDGQPFWNGVHKGWWISPAFTEMAEAFEEAYLNREKVNREEIREFTQAEYDIEVVKEKYMK